jgi:uncharacterized protein DUF6603
MTAERGTLETVGEHLSLALEPLAGAVEDLDAFQRFMQDLGWDVNDLPPAWVAIGSAVQDAIADVRALASDPSPEDIASLLDNIRQVHAAVASAPAPSGADATAFAGETVGRLFELLLLRYCARAFPAVYHALQILGIVVIEVIPEAGSRPARVRTRLVPEQVPKLVTDPMSIPRVVYGWGTADLDFDLLATHLQEVALGVGLPATIDSLARDLDAGFRPATAAENPAWVQLVIPVIGAIVAGTPVEASIAVLELPADDGELAGIILQPLVPSELGTSFEITETLTFELRAGTDVAARLGVLIRPGGVSIRSPFDGGAATADFGAALDYAPQTPRTLLGTPGATRIEVAGARAELGMQVGGSGPELRIAVQTTDLALVLEAPESDGFLRKVIGEGKQTLGLPLSIAYSTRTGFAFGTGPKLELRFAPHLKLGPLTIDDIELSLVSRERQGKAAADVTVAADIKGDLGPVHLTIQSIGAILELTFAAGNAGPFGIGVGFKMPKAVGLQIDAEVVKGGGFLLIDQPKGLYAGILRLDIKGGIAVTAIGLITTKLPDGSPGFSLLVIIAVELPSIQLGFGFTLNGIGGLLGVNRRMDVDALRAGVRNRVLDSILFPPDPVKNATKVIADLQAVFPIAPGRFVIGLMLRLGWGTPTVISVDLGLILELPPPLRIAILGRLSLSLPQGKAVVQLKMDVLGILDFDRREASIDATIYDSRIAMFTLTGDMAARLSFGASPAFALSAGGFNKRFTPPPEFPQLNRMAIALATSDNPRLTLQAYFAKTPATIQFGARLDVYAALDLGFIGFFEASGYLSFDALIQGSPPTFVIDIAGGLVLRRNGAVLFGIEIWLTLSGPTPWRACGEATFHLLGKRTIPFDVTIGGSAVLPPLPSVDPLGDLLKALGTARNWTGLLPAGGVSPVTVSPPAPGTAAVVHPLGSLTVRQETLPLALDLSRYHNVDLASPQRFDIQSVRFGATAVPIGDETRTHFATGEYVTRSGDENLTQPAYERFRAGRTGLGFTAGAEPVSCGTAVARPDESFDQIVIDQAEPQPKPAPYDAAPEVLEALVATAAAARATARTTGADGYAGPPSGLALRDAGYRITRRHDGSAAATTRYATAAEAREAAAGDDSLQVVGAHEVAA